MLRAELTVENQKLEQVQVLFYLFFFVTTFSVSGKCLVSRCRMCLSKHKYLNKVIHVLSHLTLLSSWGKFAALHSCLLMFLFPCVCHLIMKSIRRYFTFHYFGKLVSRFVTSSLDGMHWQNVRETNTREANWLNESRISIFIEEIAAAVQGPI